MDFLSLTALLITLIGGVFTFIAGLKAQPLVPLHQKRLFEIRAILREVFLSVRNALNIHVASIRETKKSIGEYSASQFDIVQIVEENLDKAIKELKEGKERNFLEETPTKSRIRLFYLIALTCFVISFILQSCIVMLS